jgi:putative lipoprotein
MHRIFLPSVMIALTIGAAGVAAQEHAIVTGTVAYRERIALPPTATIEVTLEDVSRADVTSDVIARTQLIGGRTPMAFELPFEVDDIDGSRRYAVRARIVDGDRVLFTTANNALVLTQGHGNRAEVMLAMVASPVPPPPEPRPSSAPAADMEPLAEILPRPIELAGLPASFSGTLACPDCRGIRYELNLFPDDSFFLRTTRLGVKPEAAEDHLGSWVRSSDRRSVVLESSRGTREVFASQDARTLRKLGPDGRPVGAVGLRDLRRASRFSPVDVRASMSGIVRAEGDVLEFTECSTGQRWPVTPNDVATQLRTAALKAGTRAGNAVYATIDGRVSVTASRLGQGSVDVARVVETANGKSCAPRFASVPLDGTSWRLTTLAGSAIPESTAIPTAGTVVPSLVFNADSSSFGGNGGCNRLTGAYRTNGEALRLQGIGTLKACAEGTEREALFRGALNDTRSYRILGRTLELVGPERQTLATFEATD